MIEKKAPTQVPVNDLIARRWSGRAYDAGRSVEPEKLLACIEAARWALSCYGEQPWRYLIAERDREQEAWQAVLDCLGEFNQGWAQHAPALIVAVAAERYQRNGEPNRWAQHDTGAASINLCLQAADLGLMAHQMGGFDPERAKKAFSIPADHTPMAVIAVGYQLAEEALPEAMRERELAPRERHPLGERFFAGAWGRPWRA